MINRDVKIYNDRNRCIYQETGTSWYRCGYNSSGDRTFLITPYSWLRYTYDKVGRMVKKEGYDYHNKRNLWVNIVYDGNSTNPIFEDNDSGLWTIYSSDVPVGKLRSNNENRFYPYLAKIQYGAWTDEMFIKFEGMINWELISFLPTLSDDIINKHSDKLDLDIVYFFKNLVFR